MSASRYVQKLLDFLIKFFANTIGLANFKITDSIKNWFKIRLFLESEYFQTNDGASGERVRLARILKYPMILDGYLFEGFESKLFFQVIQLKSPEPICGNAQSFLKIQTIELDLISE